MIDSICDSCGLPLPITPMPRMAVPPKAHSYRFSTRNWGLSLTQAPPTSFDSSAMVGSVLPSAGWIEGAGPSPADEGETHVPATRISNTVAQANLDIGRAPFLRPRE